MKDKQAFKEVIYNCLDFIRYQVENDKCTATEIESLATYLITEVNALATIDEIAKHFGQSRSNVSNVLSRRFVPDREKERVTRYKFGWFLGIKASSWSRK